MNGLYSTHDESRLKNIQAEPEFTPEPYRTPWRRDYARLLHSPSFRRLQGKQQLFPGIEADFFRNRLTHSLEVAQIAKSIAMKLNHDFEKSGHTYRLEPDIAEFAGLAHDLGHPPFGHFGEEVLDRLMKDCGGFEGNAQTLRILAKLEKRQLIENTDLGIDESGKDKRVGLNLTFRSLASILKYDNQIPRDSKQRKTQGVIKGYYHTESDLVKEIKDKTSSDSSITPFKTIECQIMDLADDIAYSTYDLEDSFKARFIKPLDLICAPLGILQEISLKLKERINVKLPPDAIHERIRDIFFSVFESPITLEDEKITLTDELIQDLHWASLDHAYETSNNLAANGYERTNFTSKLVGAAIRNVTIREINKEVPALSKVVMAEDNLINVEILKNFVFKSQILSPKIQIFAKRSTEIIEVIFNALESEDAHLLLPDDFGTIHQALKSKNDKKRTICDFIAGMTDNYAIEFYGRLKAINPQTIFKPMS